ncbi:MAG: AAA family ATPase, partial [Clostridia bacterium]|nr:AAA family ATPase [Clostridia bacterium]
MDDAEARSAFISAYDNATQRHGVKWNLTMGLYWIRPWNFPTLDNQSRRYINKKLNIQIGMNDPKGLCNATDYLAVLDTLEARFQEEAYPVHSFPELSFEAWLFKDSGTSAHPNATDPDAQDDEIYKEVNNRSTIKNKENSGTLSKKNNYWIYSPGEGASKWDEFYQQGIMGIGWEKLGDLNQYANQDAISQKMRELGKIENPINDSLAMWEFAKVIQKGDIVFAKNGMLEIIGRGVIDSEYKFDSDRDEYKHIRKVIWTNKGVWAHPDGKAPVKTLTKLEKDINYIRSLEGLFKGEDKSEEETTLLKYSKEKFLAEVFMEDTEYNRLVRLIETKKNVILQGPPGVGKTFASKRLAYSIMGEKDEKRVMMVQFHQSYSYEDFIMGFR